MAVEWITRVCVCWVISALQLSGIWSRIQQQKPIFVEPKTKAEFCTAMDNFYERINSGDGAVFAAVCRGKVAAAFMLYSAYQ